MKPQFEELEARHEFQSYEMVRKGESLAPDTSWSGELLEELLQLQAKKDALKELVRQAKEKIELQKQKEKEEKEANILKYGLSGEPILSHKGSEHDFKGVPNAKPVVEIDGQNVSLHPDSHIPYIDEPELSDYHGMLLIDYRDMAEAWRKEHGLSDEDITKANYERTENDKTHIDYQALYRQKGIDEDSFPEWPEDARRIDEL